MTELQCSEMSTKRNPPSQIPITAIMSCRVVSFEVLLLLAAAAAAAVGETAITTNRKEGRKDD